MKLDQRLVDLHYGQRDVDVVPPFCMRTSTRPHIVSPVPGCTYCSKLPPHFFIGEASHGRVCLICLVFSC